MKVNGTHCRTIWLDGDGRRVWIIDQTRLPHRFETICLDSVEAAAEAIRVMRVRGAPLVGVTAAFGLCLALWKDCSDDSMQRAVELLRHTRPTAVNLHWALEMMLRSIERLSGAERIEAAYARAVALADEDVATCRRLARHGAEIIHEIAAGNHRGPVRILTHCNAGWLATVDWGTALAPVYRAFDEGVDVEVWVDETRPRNQGASLTAWELQAHGVPCTLIADNAGGHLMQTGRVDLCLVGTDRTTRRGDVANKIGTYLKALAARDCGVPFYVAAPHSSIDWSMEDGLREIPIEERGAEEVHLIQGLNAAGEVESVRISPEGVAAANPAFDVTPARLVTALITDRGVCPASTAGLATRFPEYA